MSRSIVVTQAVMDDLEHAADLFNQYRIFYKQEEDFEGAKAFILDRMIHRDSVIFLARDTDSEQYVGFMQLYPTYSSISMQKSWILNDLYVRESFRGFGVGKNMLEQAKKYAIQTGAKELSLATAVDNFIGQKLYEKHGYEKDTLFYYYYLKV